jgi:hypothetical protein
VKQQGIVVCMSEKELNSSPAGASSQHGVWMIEERLSHSPIFRLGMGTRMLAERQRDQIQRRHESRLMRVVIDHDEIGISKRGTVPGADGPQPLA